MIFQLAFPLLCAYAFACIAAMALAGSLVRKSLVLAPLAAVCLAISYVLGAWDIHLLIAGANRKFYLFADGFRILFVALTYHEATRVLFRRGSAVLNPDDQRRAMWQPAIVYFGAALLFFIASMGGEKNVVPWNLWITMATAGGGLIQIVNRLRPKELDPDNMLRNLIHDRTAPDGMIKLNLFPRQQSTVMTAPLLTRTEASNLTSLLMVGIVAMIPALLDNVFREKALWTVPADAVLAILLLPCFFGMVQFQARELLFDVVIKRGILLLALACLCSLAVPAVCSLAGLSLTLENLLALTIATALLSIAWVWTYRRGDGLLNRLIFHRRDYSSSLRQLTQQMTQSATEEDLINSATSGLADALRADWVEWSHQAVKPETAAVAKVTAGDRVFGYLLCGPRYRSQPYRSEDLQFLNSFGAHFASALQGFEARRLEELAARSELKALRAQINPHFLFNALNTLADMSRSTPEAEQAILNLARVFRFALDSTRRETVPLREEIGFIRSYLEIEKARFESKLHFSIDVPSGLLESPVPPMLLQPLVENAIKHGVSKKVDGGWVKVSATPSLHGISFKVQDNGAGFDVSTLKENVGISNVRKRVEAMGGSWSVDANPGKGAAFSFELPVGVIA